MHSGSEKLWDGIIVQKLQDWKYRVFFLDDQEIADVKSAIQFC